MDKAVLPTGLGMCIKAAISTPGSGPSGVGKYILSAGGRAVLEPAPESLKGRELRLRWVDSRCYRLYISLDPESECGRAVCCVCVPGPGYLGCACVVQVSL